MVSGICGTAMFTTPAAQSAHAPSRNSRHCGCGRRSAQLRCTHGRICYALYWGGSTKDNRHTGVSHRLTPAPTTGGSSSDCSPSLRTTPRLPRHPRDGWGRGWGCSCNYGCRCVGGPCGCGACADVATAAVGAAAAGASADRAAAMSRPAVKRTSADGIFDCRLL